MKMWHEKTHTFRLTKEDYDLHFHLTNLPRNKKSETIRNMLLYALENMYKRDNKDKKNNYDILIEEITLLKKEITELREMNKKIFSLIESGSFAKTSTSSRDHEEVTIDESADETLDNLFETFDINFD
mgnify:CR=1 FL=1